MTKIKFQNLFLDFSALLLIVLFVYTATSKLLDYDNFVAQLGQSPVLTKYAEILVIVIPVIEYLIALLFLITKFRTLAFYASFSLMIMFTTYIIIILNFSDFIPCSCGGVLEDLGWTEHIIFNLVFVILSAASILFGSSKNTLNKTMLI